LLHIDICLSTVPLPSSFLLVFLFFITFAAVIVIVIFVARGRRQQVLDDLSIQSCKILR